MNDTATAAEKGTVEECGHAGVPGGCSCLGEGIAKPVAFQATAPSETSACGSISAAPSGNLTPRQSWGAEHNPGAGEGAANQGEGGGMQREPG